MHSGQRAVDCAPGIQGGLGLPPKSSARSRRAPRSPWRASRLAQLGIIWEDAHGFSLNSAPFPRISFRDLERPDHFGRGYRLAAGE